MSWRLEVRHTSGYRYKTPVSSSYNEARITPLTTASQTTVESHIDISPRARSFRYWDYWGTLVHAFDLHERHTELVVTGRSVVETSEVAPPPAPMGWDELDLRSGDWVEYLLPTRHVPLGAAVAEGLGNLRRTCADPASAARESAGWIRSAMRYEPGTTMVSTTADEALAARHGVCQDFAHVLLSLLRSAGVPTRYVSGYLHPAHKPEVGTTIRGESHAWVEAWVGDWLPLDPTNGQDPGLRHVLVARGRDYGDVAPLRGIYSGGAAHALEVDVELTRTA